MKIDNNSKDDFLRWYESLLQQALDPFCGEIKGHFELVEIGKAAEDAFTNYYEALRKKKEEKDQMVNTIAVRLLSETSFLLERIFLKETSSYAYMPNLLIYAKEVGDKLALYE